jgi:hypothetical protein
MYNYVHVYIVFLLVCHQDISRQFRSKPLIILRHFIFLWHGHIQVFVSARPRQGFPRFSSTGVPEFQSIFPRDIASLESSRNGPMNFVHPKPQLQHSSQNIYVLLRFTFRSVVCRNFDLSWIGSERTGVYQSNAIKCDAVMIESKIFKDDSWIDR